MVSRDLAVDIRALGDASRFARVDRGKFLLRASLSSALVALSDELCAEAAYALREIPDGDGCACLAYATDLAEPADDRQLIFLAMTRPSVAHPEARA